MSVSKFLEAHLASLAIGTAAVVVSCYILYGPTHRRRKSEDVKGLVNTGNSCFVNAILQALASCPAFYYWLQNLKQKPKERSLQTGLYTVLGVLNNLEFTECPDPYSPAPVLQALRSHGWVINREEQDAHEMLNVVMTTLEEEIQTRSKSSQPTHASLLDISSIGLSDTDDESDDNNETSDVSLTLSFPSPRRRGVSLPPESPPSGPQHTPGGNLSLPLRRTTSMSRDTSPSSESKGYSRRHRRSSSGVFSKFGEQLPRALESLTAGKTDLTPFTGMLTNKLSDLTGKSKSPVKYSSFNNITLNLPAQGFGFVSLDMLLQMFISQESVDDGERSGGLIKQLTFGKLPECLCFHIQRTGFSGGQPFKRHEFVEFPSILSMDKFLYSTQLIKQKSISHLSTAGGYSMGPISLASHSGDFISGLYSLRAVIVHSGGISSGHYVTYRKGPIGSKTSKKWYYTSDTLVKQVPYSEVSRACAYMLFYQRDEA